MLATESLCPPPSPQIQSWEDESPSNTCNILAVRTCPLWAHPRPSTLHLGVGGRGQEAHHIEHYLESGVVGRAGDRVVDGRPVDVVAVLAPAGDTTNSAYRVIKEDC